MSGQPQAAYYGTPYTPGSPAPPQEQPPPYAEAVNYDAEPAESQRISGGNGSNAFSSFSEESMRRAFIKKVYSILMVQLLVTVGIVCIFTFVDSVRMWVRRNLWFYILSYVTFLVTYIVLICCPHVRRRYPGNYVCLGVFTLAMSYVTGTIASFHEAWAVAICLGICTLVCLGVTLFAVFTKIDFTKLYAYLIYFGLAFFLFGIACLLVWLITGPNRVLQAVYGGIGAILFSLYLCYDTQMIIGGRRHQLSEEEYITGALEIYMDVVQIFLMLLMLVGIGEN